MQTGKKTTRNSSKGKYMDIIRPAQKSPRSTKRPVIIEATRVTNEVFDPEIDDNIETLDELEFRVAPTPKPQPAKKPAPVTPRPRQTRKEYPFISSVNVDKRPLSPYVPKNSAAPARPEKNVYSAPAKPLKKVKKSAKKADKKATKVVEPPKKQGLSLAIIIIITVLLGAAAGVGAYLLLPH
ncbi:hypothetical protein IJI94_00770 [Candidatus Saccharibacteria bacterium]|nr:hypothetical protein [Candidatus Saccharibacteria bacterium]